MKPTSTTPPQFPSDRRGGGVPERAEPCRRARRALGGLAVLGALSLSAAALAQGGEANLEQVLARYHEAIGGLEAWRSWRTARTHGTMSGGDRPAVPYTMTFSNRPRPGSRLDFTVDGKTGTMAWDGEMAWTVNPFLNGEPTRLPEEQASSWVEQSDLAGPLVDSAAKGIALELRGRTQVEDRPAWEIAVTMPSGQAPSFFLDAETFLPLRVESRAVLQGVEMEIETRFTEFRSVGGLVLPHVFESGPKGGAVGQTVTIERVELDVEVPEGFFSMPGGDGGE